MSHYHSLMWVCIVPGVSQALMGYSASSQVFLCCSNVWFHIIPSDPLPLMGWFWIVPSFLLLITGVTLFFLRSSITSHWHNSASSQASCCCSLRCLWVISDVLLPFTKVTQCHSMFLPASLWVDFFFFDPRCFTADPHSRCVSFRVYHFSGMNLYHSYYPTAIHWNGFISFELFSAAH